LSFSLSIIMPIHRNPIENPSFQAILPTNPVV
jgi:hypothetical protein